MILILLIPYEIIYSELFKNASEWTVMFLSKLYQLLLTFWDRAVPYINNIWNRNKIAEYRKSALHR